MFKKILATSLAILTLSASGTMVHGEGEGLESRMKSLQSLSLYKRCLRPCAFLEVMPILSDIYTALLYDYYDAEYKKQMEEAKNDKQAYYIEMLEEIDYLVGLRKAKPNKLETISNLEKIVCVNCDSRRKNLVNEAAIISIENDIFNGLIKEDETECPEYKLSEIYELFETSEELDVVEALDVAEPLDAVEALDVAKPLDTNESRSDYLVDRKLMLRHNVAPKRRNNNLELRRAMLSKRTVR